MMAAENGHLQVVKLLLEEGAEVNAKMADGRTATLLAKGNSSGGRVGQTSGLPVSRASGPVSDRARFTEPEAP